MNRQDFYEKVYQVVARIPIGKVTTYGAISKSLGIASGARMVGYALNSSITNSSSDELPCHRVVNRNGELTGSIHFGKGVMEARLLAEEISFLNENTIDINRHFWNPENETE